MMDKLKNTSFARWIAGSLLVVTTASVLGGCIVETPRRHRYYRPVAVVR